MGRKHYKSEQIVQKLHQVEVLHAKGKTMSDAIRVIGVSELTYYRWHKGYGGMGREQLTD